MANKYNYNFCSVLNKIMLNEQEMKQFDEFMEQYGEKSDRDIIDEIKKTATNVSREEKQVYINNLKLLDQMEGFVTSDVRRRINKLQNILVVKETSIDQKVGMLNYKSNFYYPGRYLTFWFLILLYLFRRPYYYPYYYPYRYPYRRPFF